MDNLEKIDREADSKLSVEQLNEIYGPLHPTVVKLLGREQTKQKGLQWKQERQKMVTAADVRKSTGGE